MKPRTLALIPARGGSRRLPRKNILPLGGRPLIAWSIEAALAARSVTRVIVSTDDSEIAAVARALGAEVPFMRPPALAGDTASGEAVVLHALDFFEATGERYDRLLLLQPTSPLRTAEDIDGAARLMSERDAHAVISVCPCDHPPEWSNTLPPDGSLRAFFRPGVRGTRSQDLPTSYRLNGALYLYDWQHLARQRSLAMDDKGYAWIMPRERSVDIDTALDLRFAEVLLQQREAAA